jgi:DNA processing protein
VRKPPRSPADDRGGGAAADDLFAAAPLPVAPLDDASRLACLRLVRSENVGPVTFRALINRFGGAEAALSALPELSRRGGHGKAIQICRREVAEAELAAAARCGARPIFTIEPGYPAALAHVDVPPPMLYVRGDAALFDRPAIAIVGSREASAAGIALTRKLSGELGAAGYVIVSGLARGTDSAAHAQALATGTVAVIAGGVDTVYPPENAGLQDEIATRGCLVSEMPPGFTPRAQDFPRRNRIISGISLGVVVVEAARRSGTLITARMAGEQGREVFAVPGHPLDPRAEGTNHLIKNGATFVTSAEDILTALAPIARPSAPPRISAFETPPPVIAPRAPAPPEPSLSSDDQARVVAVLGPAPVAIDDVCRTTGLQPRAVQIALLELALAGRIEQHGASLVSLKAPA